jgi:acyl dehydratase
MGAIVFGTTVVSGMGTASLAAHEILRQARPQAAPRPAVTRSLLLLLWGHP